MILGKPREPPPSDGLPRKVTLDDLFRRALERGRDAPALIDPPDRQSFTDGAPKQLSYAEADRVVSAIAARLKGLRLPTDTIVAAQLPNTVESVLTLLGVLRAGMIPALVPLLWREEEAIKALSRISARALVTMSRIGPVDHGELAMHIAAGTFTIRFVCTFGQKQLDGVAAFDDVFDTQEACDGILPIGRGGDPADHVAVVTFDITPDGLVPVARSHGELFAGGLAVALEGRIQRNSMFLAGLATSSFAGLAASIVPWLLSGGTLSLHQAFEPATFSAQCESDLCDLAVLPGPLIARLEQAGLIGGPRGPKTILAVWRAPERAAASAVWPHNATGLIDVLAFGETGLVAFRRGTAGTPAPITQGPMKAARSQGDGPVLIDIARTEAGTLALDGAMIPHYPFPPGIERSGAPRLKIGADGSIDTFYPCRLDRVAGTLTLDGPPAGIVSVGGYRFALKQLEDFVVEIADGSSIAALPDALAGHRLAGIAIDRTTIRQALAAHGVNPLIVGAFSERRSDRASAA